MNKLPSISVIITTYNRPDVLTLVLLALSAQTLKNFEVIIADDGSSEITRNQIELMREHLAFPLKYVWQPHIGFRAAKIRNKAVAAAEGNYLIFLDGDCIVQKTFISRHFRLAEKGWLVVGNRILLDKNFTSSVLEDHTLLHQWSNWHWFGARLRGKINRFMPFINLSYFVPRKTRKRKWQGAKTCNLALWKEDFFAVNGFDEGYWGWGYEDSDLVIRLMRNNVLRKDAHFGTPVVHLWHMQNDRCGEPENFKRLSSSQKSARIRAIIGVDQYVASC